MKYDWQEKQDQRREERRPKPKTKKPINKKKEIDADLWDAFSLFIRARDANNDGICKCFTCGRLTIWNKNTDCGHGIPRQHKATKYNEINNQAQCKSCNGFQGGMRESFKKEMDKRYGEGTWDKMELASRKPCKFSKFDIDIMTAHYKGLFEELVKQKGLK